MIDLKSILFDPDIIRHIKRVISESVNQPKQMTLKEKLDLITQTSIPTSSTINRQTSSTTKTNLQESVLSTPIIKHTISTLSRYADMDTREVYSKLSEIQILTNPFKDQAYKALKLQGSLITTVDNWSKNTMKLQGDISTVASGVQSYLTRKVPGFKKDLKPLLIPLSWCIVSSISMHAFKETIKGKAMSSKMLLTECKVHIDEMVRNAIPKNQPASIPWPPNVPLTGIFITLFILLRVMHIVGIIWVGIAINDIRLMIMVSIISVILMMIIMKKVPALKELTI